MVIKRNYCQTKVNNVKKKKSSRGKKTNGLNHEMAGLAILTLALLGLAGYFTSSVGIVGDFVKWSFTLLAGDGGILIPFLLGLFGISVMGKFKGIITQRILGILLLYVSLLVYLHSTTPPREFFATAYEGNGGGIIGASIGYVLYQTFGIVGTYIVLASSLLVSLLLITGMGVGKLGGMLVETGRIFWGYIISGLKGFLFQAGTVAPQRVKVMDKTCAVDSGETDPKAGALTPGHYAPAGPKEKGHIIENGKKDENKGLEETFKNRRSVSCDGEADQFLPLELADGRSYHFPPAGLLSAPVSKDNSGIDKEIEDKIAKLESALESFNIKAKVTGVSVGPAITRYEIQPPAGVKVSRIVGLADDIALSMAAPDVRIEAPIPGKAAVGIEVPNREISMVYFRELTDSGEFTSSSSKLTVALGKDIAGTPIIADLGRMPHLLVAGATGAGKSVCINTLITSILYRATPDEVKLLMVDPKMVELTTYNGIPHLISPVVTDSKKAAGTLRWAVKEMERRYELFAAAGVRDIHRYNEMCNEYAAAGQQPPLPFIVIIIDELADLMMVAPADVEDSICRIAQMARAAGMHLVVATQRPSVDVITGLIKANIPSRISFAVSSQVDSRTILDMGGAEKLLGKGDMLFYPVGIPKPLRVQGAYLSDKEVERVVDYIKDQAQPVYDENVMEVQPVEESGSPDSEYEDELLPQAVKILIENGNASISMLQRRLHIGYARAARLIDIMERRGIVGGYEGSKPRNILMTLEQYHQTFNLSK